MAKSGGTKVPLQKASNKVAFEVGDTVICTHSGSCAYTVGSQYEVYLNDKGWKCINGNDGLEDIVSMMVSSFRKVS